MTIATQLKNSKTQNKLFENHKRRLKVSVSVLPEYINHRDLEASENFDSELHLSLSTLVNKTKTDILLSRQAMRRAVRRIGK